MGSFRENKMRQKPLMKTWLNTGSAPEQIAKLMSD
jgi:hypothetical protein